jgi:hypothetical protein
LLEILRLRLGLRPCAAEGHGEQAGSGNQQARDG